MEYLLEILGRIDIRFLVTSAIITSILVSAANVFSTQLEGIRNRYLIGVISAVVTLLSTTFEDLAGFADWQKLILSMLLTTAFSVIFYLSLGQFFVDKLLGAIKKFFVDKFPKEDPKP